MKDNMSKGLLATAKNIEKVNQGSVSATRSVLRFANKAGTAVTDFAKKTIKFGAAAATGLAAGFLALDNATEEYRIAQGKLNTAYEAAGYSARAASTAYGEFYKILGDTDTATEASQLLAKLTRSEQDVTSWTRIAAGVSGQRHIQDRIDTSLRNLGLDHVDLYIYHMWDYETPLYDVMDGLNRVVRAGKARYIGISNCFAYQLAKANALAEKEGFAKFVSVQGHYNLIFREEEREMAKLCAEDGIAMTPYSALAGGRLSKRPGETSKRLREDSYARSKYDATAKQDAVILERVAELADKRGVSMTEVSLSWLLTKVTAPVVGATRPQHIEGAARAVALTLSPEETAYLEAPYRPHDLVGVMAQNTPAAAQPPHILQSTAPQRIQSR